MEDFDWEGQHKHHQLKSLSSPAQLPAPPPPFSTCLEQLSPTENPSTPSLGRASSVLSWKLKRHAGTAALHPCPGGSG